MNQGEICGYNISRKIGEGSFGTVTKVKDSEGKNAAFKLIKEDKEDTGIPSILEIDIVTRLKHPYLIHAFEIYTPLTCPDLRGSSVGILMPLAKTDLGIIFHPDLIPEKLLNPNINNNNKILTCNMRIKLIWQILQGVSFLHQMDIYHLDLKPWNILLFGSINDPQDPLIAKISDFGLSYYCPFPIKGCPDINKRITNSYRPPELFRPMLYTYFVEGLPISYQRYIYKEKSDIWSLGIIIAEILSGKRMIDFLNAKDSFSFINITLSPKNIDNYLNNYLPKKGLTLSQKSIIIEMIKKNLSWNPRDRPPISELLASPIFKSCGNENVQGIIYRPIIGPETRIKYPGYQSGYFFLENTFKSHFKLIDIGTFFLAVDIYYRALSFYQDMKSTPDQLETLKDNAELTGAASILLALGFYSLITNLIYFLKITNLKSKYNTNNLYQMEQSILNLFGNIVYRPYLYEKAPNIEALLSAYSYLGNSNYLSLDLNKIFLNQSNQPKYPNQPASKQMSVREFFELLKNQNR